MEDGAASPSTSPAPRWAAAVVLGALCAGAMAFAAMNDREAWEEARVSAALPSARAPEKERSGKTPPAPTPPDTAKPAAAGRVININTASEADLALLPGIGPALAKRIVERRTIYGPFKRVDDLDAVKGIGPRLIERIRPVASVD